MSSAAVWEHIRRGQAPTPARVGHIAAREASLVGDAGSRRRAVAMEDGLMGAGPLTPFLDDPAVTDVLVNGVRGVWVDRGAGLEPVLGDLGGEAELRRLAVRLAGVAGRRLDDSSPYVDGLLPGGIRLHAVLPPLVDGGAHLSLRVPRRRAPRLDDLVTWGACPPHVGELLRAVVTRRAAFLVTGGTGSGKTTLLAALLGEVPSCERIVVVEDVRELSLDHPHAVCLQARPANVEGAGAVDLATLVRQSLRMRPDRVVVGEVRGAEVRDMLTALNTGHEGGCGTVHANTPGDVVARMEALGGLAGMSPAATRSQLVSALRVVLHMRRDGAARVLDSIGIITGDARRCRVLSALERRGDGHYEPQGAMAELDRLLGHPSW